MSPRRASFSDHSTCQPPPACSTFNFDLQDATSLFHFSDDRLKGPACCGAQVFGPCASAGHRDGWLRCVILEHVRAQAPGRWRCPDTWTISLHRPGRACCVVLWHRHQPGSTRRFSTFINTNTLLLTRVLSRDAQSPQLTCSHHLDH